MKPVPVVAPARPWPGFKPSRWPWSALGAFFWLTLRQHAHGRRLWVLAALFALPAGLAVLLRCLPQPAPADILENALIFTLIPHALAPLTALLYAGGMIQDEVEDQTLTYLLVRPLPRGALYVTRLLATLLVIVALTAVCTGAVFAAMHWGAAEAEGGTVALRALKTVALLTLAQVAYCSLFGCISLYARRWLLAGVAYILIFEGLLANLNLSVRRLTIVYYFRDLYARWLDRDVKGWSLDLATAPTAQACVVTLLAVSVVATLLAALAFTAREFRVKTPEGS